jgi:hypothetical protein
VAQNVPTAQEQDTTMNIPKLGHPVGLSKLFGLEPTRNIIEMQEIELL